MNIYLDNKNDLIESKSITTPKPSWCFKKTAKNGVGTMVDTPNSTITYEGYTYLPSNCSFNINNGTVTCTVPGRYFVFFNAFGQPINGINTLFSVYIRKNNIDTEHRVYTNIIGNTVYQPSISLQGLIDLNIGDTVSIFMYSGRFHPNDNCVFGGFMVD